MINKLTPEQQAYLPIFKKKWFDIGTNCDPIDKELTEETITKMYAYIGKDKPILIYVDSPLSANLLINILNSKNSLRDSLWDSLENSLGDSLRDSLENSLRNSLEDSLWDSLRNSLWDSLGSSLRNSLMNSLRNSLRNSLENSLGDSLENSLEDSLGDSLMNSLRNSLRNSLENSLGDSLWDSLGDSLWDSLGNSLRDSLRDLLDSKNTKCYLTWLWGQQDSYWIAFYKFCNEIGINYDKEKLVHLSWFEDLAKSCMWWWPFENICIVSNRPKEVNFDNNLILHNENGPSVSFRDGWSIYNWHGTLIPKEWINEKDKLTPEIALTWENVEQRRCACEIIGWDKVLEHPSLNPVVIDEDSPHIGKLIQVDLPNAPEQWFIKYQCGTGRWFAEAVNDKSFNTALKANAGGNGWRPGAGDPDNFIPFVRT